MGGSVGRMAEFAQTVADELGELESVAIPYGMRPSAIGKTDRCSMFKVGPVLISSHGMGQPSMSILLHEVAKLLDYAGADDPVFIRLGTSGGLGVKPGTVVVTNEGMNGMLGSDYTLPVNGKMISRPAKFHEATVRMQHEVVGVG
jgi:uridine phosphorylase